MGNEDINVTLTEETILVEFTAEQGPAGPPPIWDGTEW